MSLTDEEKAVVVKRMREYPAGYGSEWGVGDLGITGPTIVWGATAEEIREFG